MKKQSMILNKIKYYTNFLNNYKYSFILGMGNLNDMNILYENAHKYSFFWEKYLYYKNLTAFGIIFLFILLLGLNLPERAKIVRFINLTSFFLILLNIIITSWDIFVILPIDNINSTDNQYMLNAINNLFTQAYTNIDINLTTKFKETLFRLENTPHINLFKTEYIDDSTVELIFQHRNPYLGSEESYFEHILTNLLIFQDRFFELSFVDFADRYFSLINPNCENLQNLPNDLKNFKIPFRTSNRELEYSNFHELLNTREIQKHEHNNKFVNSTINVYKDGIHCNENIYKTPTTFLGNNGAAFQFNYRDNTAFVMNLIPFYIDTLFYNANLQWVPEEDLIFDLMLITMKNKLMAYYTGLNAAAFHVFLNLEVPYSDSTEKVTHIPDIGFSWDFIHITPTTQKNIIFTYINLYNFYLTDILNLIKFELKCESFYKNFLPRAFLRYHTDLIFGVNFENFELIKEYFLLNDVYDKILFKENYVYITGINSLLTFVNLFEFISIITTCIFFFGIADRYYLKENKTIEYALLILLIQISAIIALNSNDFMEIILALECISLCSYILVGYERHNKFSTHAGIRYLIISTVPSAILILGASLIYRNFGTLYKDYIEILLSSMDYKELSKIINIDLEDLIFGEINSILAEVEKLPIYTDVINNKNWKSGYNYFLHLPSNKVIYKELSDIYTDTLISDIKILSTLDNCYVTCPEYEWIAVEAEFLKYVQNYNFTLYYNYVPMGIYIAILFILTNFLYKITGAPFHIWAPTIYGNSPLPTVTYLSIFSKITIVFLTINFLSTIFKTLINFWEPFIIFCSILTMICGILGAISERLLKRFFVYSSMSHISFILLGIAVSNTKSLNASINYLIVYIISSFIIWFILMLWSRQFTHLTNLKLLNNNNNVLCFIFTTTMFSMSGIPPLGGFFVKFEILHCLINSSQYFVTILILLLTVISFFYYLRIIKIIYFESEKKFIKIKYYNVNKLRFVTFAWHFLVFFILFMQPPIFYIIFNSLKTLS